MSRSPAALAALLLTALAGPAVPAPASAEPPRPEDGDSETSPDVSEADRAVARRHFTRGKELHAAGNYREAAQAYLAAYDRFPAPAFLYNVAQVYRLAGDKQRALEHYRKYLKLEPEGEGSADAREFVAALEAAIAAERDGAASDGEQPAPAPIPDSAASRGPLDPIAQRGAVDRDVGGKPGRGKKIAGIAFAAAGAVGLGVGFVFALKARSADDDLSSFEGPWSKREQDIYDDGKSAERTALLSAIVGGGALATGAVLYYLGNREAKRASERRDRASGLKLGAAPTADGGLLVIGGAF